MGPLALPLLVMFSIIALSQSNPTYELGNTGEMGDRCPFPPDENGMYPDYCTQWIGEHCECIYDDVHIDQESCIRNNRTEYEELANHQLDLERQLDDKRLELGLPSQGAAYMHVRACLSKVQEIADIIDTEDPETETGTGPELPDGVAPPDVNGNNGYRCPIPNEDGTFPRYCNEYISINCECVYEEALVPMEDCVARNRTEYSMLIRKQLTQERRLDQIRINNGEPPQPGPYNHFVNCLRRARAMNNN